MTPRIVVGRLLAGLGVLVIVVELLLYWLSPYLLGGPHALTAAPVALGCLFGFVGFYMLDHQETVEGASVVVSSVVRIADALPRPAFMRAGRRDTDPPVATPAVVPPAPPPRDPVVTEEHDAS